MTTDEIKHIVESSIAEAKANQEVENNKIDFKLEWYDLSTLKGVNEFTKDTSAIANTFGLDGIIIIGYDNKTNTFKDAKFEDSRLKDFNEIPGIITKKVDRMFDINPLNMIFEGHSLNIIHIPPSLDKPHVIRNYQTFDKNGNVKNEEHKVFVRKASTTRAASKNDFELMYYDRKNIIPEYKLITSYHSSSWILNYVSSVGCHIALYMTFENTGRRPIAINEISFQMSFYMDPNPSERLSVKSSNDYLSKNIIIHPNEIVNLIVEFININTDEPQKSKFLVEDLGRRPDNIKLIDFNIKMSNGKKIETELIKLDLY